MTLISKQEINKYLNDNHYSDKTIVVYQSWIERFIKHYDLNPHEFNTDHIKDYLHYLSNVKKLKASSINQALNAIVFFYDKSLNKGISKSTTSTLRVGSKKHLTKVLTKQQIESIIHQLKGFYQLIVYLLYGCGLRSSEVLKLKLKDFDIQNKKITIHAVHSSRELAIPEKIINQLISQISFIESTYEKDISNKFFNKTEKSDCYLFPMKHFCNNEQGLLTRKPIISNTLNYNINMATKKTGISIKVTAQSFRHAYAVHLLQNQIDTKTVQKLLGHKHISSTMIYTYSAEKDSSAKPLSPLDITE